MSERLDFARRRLELTDAVEAGDAIEGSFGRQPVRLIAGAGEQTLEVTCRQVPIERLSLRITEPNDPDVVFTGDASFDGAVLLLARDGHGPQCAKLFAAPAVREMARELFRLFPGAEWREGKLTVPHLSLDPAVTALALTTATSFVREVIVAWSGLEEVPLEEAPRLPAEDVDVRRRRRLRRAVVVGMGAGAGAIVALTIGWTSPGLLAFFVAGGALLGLIASLNR